MNGIETNPYVDDFRKTHLDKHIRAEHKHLQMKILYTKRSYKSMNMVTDKFDSYSDAIFYKELRELKKIFAK